MHDLDAHWDYTGDEDYYNDIHDGYPMYTDSDIDEWDGYDEDDWDDYYDFDYEDDEDF